MYVKRATVRRGEHSYVYLRLVEAYRQDGKVRHRVIANLGREDELKASGQLDQLAASLARLDPPPWGTRRDVGSLLLVRHYLQRLGLVKIIDDAVPQRGRAQLTHGEVVAALVANRLSAPAPLYDVAGWASSAAVHELLDTPAMLLGDDRLGRALEAFAPVAETVRGAVMLTAIDTFGADAARLHLDLTTLTVAGHSPGFFDRFRPGAGHQALRPVQHVTRREQHLPPDQRTRSRGALRDFAVTDPETGAERRFRVASIWPSEEARSVAQARQRALTKAEADLARVHRGLGGQHYKTHEQVQTRVNRIVGPNLHGLLTVTADEHDAKPTLTWQRDHAAIATAAQHDGIYALATNLPGRLTPSSVLSLYKDQHLVELAHRANKSVLNVRPIFLHNDDRIAALISIVGLALLIYGLIETDLRQALGPDQHLTGLLPEGRAARPTGR